MPASIIPSPHQWDEFVQQQPRAHVLQQSQWGELKAQYGWKVARVALLDEGNDSIVAGAQVLLRRLPFGLGNMGYLPMGPYVTDDTYWSQLWDAVEEHIVKQFRVAFIKWEPGIYYDYEPMPEFSKWRFRQVEQTIQPPRTVILDISGDDDEIMARMNQGTRRKIRKSLKSDVHYYEGTASDVDVFTGMMHTTGTRNEFGVHEADYYHLAYKLFVPEHAALMLAEHEGTPLAGVMVFAAADTAWYIYGASSNEKRNLMASYGIQWQAIQWAKQRGCRYYDMWGVPDADEETLEAQFQNRSDGLWGVYGFKRGWGGQLMRAAGPFDRVYNPFIYKLFNFALRLRR